MNKVAWVFHTPPHGSTAGREGLDAILATSAYSEEQALFFVGEGVLQLVNHQHPESILSRDYISAFKLLISTTLKRVMSANRVWLAGG